MRPISLLTANGSSGTGSTRDAGPEYADAARRLISTSADMFFVSTLHEAGRVVSVPGAWEGGRSRGAEEGAVERRTSVSA